MYFIIYWVLSCLTCDLYLYWLKGYAGVYFSGVILYDPPPKFAENGTVATKTRDPRWDQFQGFSISYIRIPGQEIKINKEQLFSTI